ncbi:MAG: RES family NAD+ phosphorylase [Scytonema sp. PMC 1069.18]|nr:RES family NAD+ phosphorylase [Scytonema sp. PMC 1069.18]MEC4881402.1 RES family NAD+ phosphorylase [Scytonema sp. PMC 1070.18]
MVKIVHPSLSRADHANPIFHILKPGKPIFRIYRSEYYPTALSFRAWGPLHRFDHQRGIPPRLNYRPYKCQPGNDPERRICYTAPTLSGCLVEVFGDTPEAAEITKEYQFAILSVKKDLKLLDIRDRGAMCAGANEATLAKTEKRALTQAWSRLFYDCKEKYTDVQGIIYRNAHNNEEAIVFYERGENYLSCEKKDVFSLGSPELRGHIIKAAKENNIRVIFPEWTEPTTLYFKKVNRTYARINI